MKKALLYTCLVAFATFLFTPSFAQLSGYYQEDFEGSFPPASWQVVDVLDATQTWQQSLTLSYSGSKSAYLQWSPQGVQGEDWLILPQFTVTAGDSFSFWLAVAAVPYPPDSTYILVSSTDDNLSSFTDQLGVLSEGDNYDTVSNVFWRYSFSLDNYAGQNIYVAFKNRNIYGDGVAIDLVTIGSPPAVNASAVSIDVPDYVSTATSIIPTATVKNASLTEQSFPVTMTISGGYSSTIDVNNLPAGSSTQVSFDSWTPVAGNSTVSIQTQLDGDAQIYDDTLSKVVTGLAPLSGYYKEDFEGSFPPAGWQVKDVLNTPNTWQQSLNFPYSGTNSAYLMWSPSTDPGEDWLILPQWTTASTDSFSFWLAVPFTLYIPDSTTILISTTDATLSSFTNEVTVLSEGVNYPTEAYTYWYYSYSLADYAGQNIYVALKNRNTNGDGLYVDLVRIGTPAAVNATAISIDLPSYIATSEFSPMATVKNSSITEQSFPVTLSSDGGYSSTIQVTNLGAGLTQQVTFDPWTPTGSPATLTLMTQLVGDLDPTDDVISQTTQAYEPFLNYGWTSRATSTDPMWDEGLASVNPQGGPSSLFALAGVRYGNLVAQASMYDPSSDSWTELTSMPLENYTSCATALNDKIYVIGGYNPPFQAIGNNQIYDIAGDDWSTGTDMPTPVGDYALGVYHDSLIYFMGGYDINFFTDYSSVQIYDPVNDTWTNGTDLPVTGYGWQGGISGNKIVLCGGSNSISGAILATTYVGTINPSNPADISWVQVDDNPSGPEFRPGAAASTDESSGLVIFTGGDPSGLATDAIKTTFAFDVISNSWKIGPDKPTAVNNLRNLACVVYKDSLYLVSVGGLAPDQSETNVNEWLNLGPAKLGTGITPNEPTEFSISSYPNPFAKFTTLTFTLGHSADVKVTIVDVAGRVVQELFNKNLPAGVQQINWNASSFAAGVYFAKISVNDDGTTEKLVKLK